MELDMNKVADQLDELAQVVIALSGTFRRNCKRQGQDWRKARWQATCQGGSRSS